MSNTFLPFNFAPKGHTILSTGGTTTYTIPANEFALVTVQATETSSQGSVTLDTVPVFKSSYFSSATQTSGTNAAQTVSVSADALTYYSITNISISGPIISEGIALNGTIIYAGAVASSQTKISTHTKFAGTANSGFQFWAKAANVVAISGGDLRVTIHRYDLPS
jgi:hypothetical protein